MKYFIPSIYDQDYLPFTQPTSAATWSRPVPADGNLETKLLDFPGRILTSGMKIHIPVEATGDGELPEFSQTIHISAEKTEDGVARDIELAWNMQRYTSETNFITATLRAI